MKWIKASERLPEVDIDCFLKVDNMFFTGVYWRPEGYKDSQIFCEHFNVLGRGVLTKEYFDSIYWLDESQSGEGDAVDDKFEFASYLTGHDIDTCKQMYNDYLNLPIK